MRIILTPEQMRRLEARYFERFSPKPCGLRRTARRPLRGPSANRIQSQRSRVTSIDLMERAAEALADAVRARMQGGSAYFACGTGGNGGDGLAAARILCRQGVHAEILLPGPPRSADAIENLRRAREAEVPVREADFSALPEPDIWCDALFGIGLSRAPEGGAAELIRRMNASPAPVLSADVPSGLDAETGRAFSPCVRADETLCFQHLKTGHVLGDGPDMCGRVRVADIGIPEALLDEDAALLMEPEDLARLLRPRPRNLHKGSCGHLLIVAGSFGMAGAAALCASAALRTGVGLVSIACPASIVPILQTLTPCAMCVPLAESDGALSRDGVDALRAALAGKSAVAIGCGLSRRADAEIVRAVLESGLPAAIDADALNLISESPALKSLLRPWHVLTPHPGEAARLLGKMPENPLAGARALRDLGAVAVLKGACSAIAGPSRLYLSAAGTSGMARGGSGDVLTGILGALLAEGVHPELPEMEKYALTAALACQLHGLAGEAAAARHTARAMTAMDIAQSLGEVFRQHGGE